ncbi:hypothetical protein EYR41_001776 [Orbilia oligospora]|uniref:Uncharacterized protein n=1 Tax=Orbilia oligospora TaxID=2813651 RepID=A0A8H2E970_ORBOL|nr:hypothetical protein EYR41_001776 [Orbilia oligospora]
MPLSSLSVEILGEVLSQIDDQKSLESAVLSCPLLHTAYRERRESVNHAFWRNTYADCEVYCRFLTYAVVNFLPLKVSRENIQGEDMYAFWVAYMNWSNPPQDSANFIQDIFPASSKWEQITAIPSPSGKDMAETHKYIFSWCEKLCKDRLKYNPFTKKEVNTNPPPSRTELTRICAAIYQFWIYCILYSSPVVGLSDCIRDHEGNVLGLWDGAEAMMVLVPCILEVMWFRDFVFIRNTLIGWLQDCSKPIIGKIGLDLADEVEHSAPPFTPEDDETSMWSLICGLGPSGFWKFLFENTYKEQVVTRLVIEALPQTGYRPLSMYFGNYLEDVSIRTYCPILRICKGRYNLAEEDSDWWNVAETNDQIIDKSVIMWDDWRLKEWGYSFPVLTPPLFRAELSVGEGDTEEEVRNRYLEIYGRVGDINEKPRFLSFVDYVLENIQKKLIREAMGLQKSMISNK